MGFTVPSPAKIWKCFGNRLMISERAPRYPFPAISRKSPKVAEIVLADSRPMLCNVTALVVRRRVSISDAGGMNAAVEQIGLHFSAMIDVDLNRRRTHCRHTCGNLLAQIGVKKCDPGTPVT